MTISKTNNAPQFDFKVGETLRYFAAHAAFDGPDYVCAHKLSRQSTASSESTSASSGDETNEDKLVGYETKRAQGRRSPVAELKPDVILATTPPRTQPTQEYAMAPPKCQPYVVDLSSFLCQGEDPLQHDRQNAELTPKKLAQSDFNPGIEQIVVSADAETNGDGFSKEHRRPNKASKSRRDRYKTLVELLKKNIEADPSIDPVTMSLKLPAFVKSDERLLAKLVARLQQHKQQHMLDRAASSS